MFSTRGDLVHERTLNTLVEAAGHLGAAVDVAALAPTRRQIGDDAFVPADEHRAVLHAIFADPRETLGIELAAAMRIEASGLWSFLLRSSPTFGDLLRRAERYSRVFFRYTRMHVGNSGHEVIAVCDHPRPSPFGRHEQEVSFFLGQWLTWGRALIGETFAAAGVRMRWEGPSDTGPFDAFFRCPVRFSADADAVAFDRRICEMRLPDATPELAAMFEEYAATMIRRMGPETTFVERVREALSHGLLSGSTGEEEIARQLGVTRRTLRRRLADADLTFRQLRHELMRSRAEQMLCEERLPIEEVAYLLGYGEPSSFHRAFRRWTDLSPGEWRERHIAKGSSRRAPGP
jgi:AraC-like DNA-binding protein